MSREKILITGMSGLIGQVVANRLKSTYDLSALNRRLIKGVKCYQSNINDLAEIRAAFEGIDIVIHLAAAIESDWNGFLQSNIIGTYNVFEAARQAGVRRIIYASSGAVISGYENQFPYQEIAQGEYEKVPRSWSNLTHETQVWPQGIYGCTKVWGEALARHFSDSSDMSFICLRIGAVNASDQPNQDRQFSVYCSQENIVGMVEACIKAPDRIKFDIFYVVSDNKWSYRDMEHARKMLGYQPKGQAEDYR